MTSHSCVVYSPTTATESVRKQRLSASKEKTPGLQQLDGDTGDFVDHTEMPKLKDVPKVIGKLTKNGVFVFVSLASALELFLVAGTAVFLSQLIQFQFYQKAGTAAIIGGINYQTLVNCLALVNNQTLVYYTNLVNYQALVTHKASFNYQA